MKEMCRGRQAEKRAKLLGLLKSMTVQAPTHIQAQGSTLSFGILGRLCYISVTDCIIPRGRPPHLWAFLLLEVRDEVQCFNLLITGWLPLAPSPHPEAIQDLHLWPSQADTKILITGRFQSFGSHYQETRNIIVYHVFQWASFVSEPWTLLIATECFRCNVIYVIQERNFILSRNRWEESIPHSLFYLFDTWKNFPPTRLWPRMF